MVVGSDVPTKGPRDWAAGVGQMQQNAIDRNLQKEHIRRPYPFFSFFRSYLLEAKFERSRSTVIHQTIGLRLCQRSDTMACGVCAALYGSDPKQTPYEMVEYCHRILGTSDAMEIADRENLLTLYISPNRARARLDCRTEIGRDQRREPNAEVQVIPSVEIPPPVPESGRDMAEATRKPSPPKGKRVRTVSDSDVETLVDGSDDGQGTEGGDEKEKSPGAPPSPKKPRYGSGDRFGTATNNNRRKERLRNLKKAARRRLQAKSQAVVRGGTERTTDDRRRQSSPPCRSSEIRALIEMEEQTEGMARPDRDDISTQSSPPRSEGEEQETRGWFERRLDEQPEPTSSTLRRDMWKKAGAVGGPQALEEWQNAIGYWRNAAYLEPTRGLIAPTEDQVASKKGGKELAIRKPHLAKVHPDIQAFCQVYERLDENDMDDIVRTINYRSYSATLHQRYERATPIVDKTETSGQTKATTAKVQLFKHLYPGLAEATEPQKVAPAKWKKLTRRLNFAKRWAFLRDQLGVGIFWVMPRELLPHTFVEQTLRRWNQLEVWVELVRKRSPYAIRLGETTMNQIQGMNARSRVPSKRRILETLDPVRLQTYLATEEDPTKIWDVVDEGVVTSADETSRAPSRDGWGQQPTSFSQPVFGSTNDFANLLETPTMWDPSIWTTDGTHGGNAELPSMDI